MIQIAVISGKGGTGKSSISAAFATADGQVVVADCDVDAANLHLIFDPVHEEEEIYSGSFKAVVDQDLCNGCLLCVNLCRFEAIKITGEKVTILEHSCDGCQLCSRLCKPGAITMLKRDKSRMYSGSFRNGKMVYGRLAPGEENSGKLVSMVREKAKKISNDYSVDVIILDGPPGIGCPVISTISGTDKVVIVTEPTISGFHDLIRTIMVVKKFENELFVIINKYDLNQRITGLIEEWCDSHSIRIAGKLPYDPLVFDAMTEGISIIEFDKELEISKAIMKTWNIILNNENYD